MRFVSFDDVKARISGKSVAIVGSGPGCTENAPGFVDSHELVIRVNNYKTGAGQGYRCDAHYAFFGSSIKKDRVALKADGVNLVLCKCPDTQGKPFIDSEWHRVNNKPHGTEFSYIYIERRDWWWCDTYVPSLDEFMQSFELLNRHIPSTGFSCLLLIARCDPARIFLTGFDFFASRKHNVDEPWRPGNPNDPIGHAPDLERQWLATHRDRVMLDATLSRIMEA